MMEPAKPAKRDERRHAKRSRTRLVAVIRDLKRGERGRAVTKNLSTKGMCVLTDLFLQADARVEVELTLPDRSTPLTLEGRVAWHRPLDAETSYEAGVTAEVGIVFSDLSREELIVIRAMAVLYELPDFLASGPSAS